MFGLMKVSEHERILDNLNKNWEGYLKGVEMKNKEASAIAATSAHEAGVNSEKERTSNLRRDLAYYLSMILNDLPDAPEYIKKWTTCLQSELDAVNDLQRRKNILDVRD